MMPNASRKREILFTVCRFVIFHLLVISSSSSALKINIVSSEIASAAVLQVSKCTLLVIYMSHDMSTRVGLGTSHTLYV